MKIFWLVFEKPFEVKLLANDNDVLEMVSKLPRNHYVHVYLKEVLTASSAANVEPEINVEVSDASSFEPEINVEVSDVDGSFEPDFNVEVSDVDGSFEPDCNVEVSDVDVVSDDDSLEENIGEASEIRVESNSDSEDIDYEASKSSTHESGFTDSDAEASDDVSDVHVGVGDKVRVGIDDDSRHSYSLHSVDESNSDGPRRKQRFPEFNTTVDISGPTFKVGLLFATKQVLREAVKMYSIKNRYSVRLKRNGNRRIQAVCKAGCPWVLWASPVDLKEPYGTWQVKSLTAEHRCLKEYKNPKITSKFMAKQYLDAFHIDPNYSAKSLKKDVFKDYSISVHLSKCSRANNLALEMLHGNVKEQYKKLYYYLAELRSLNPGTTTILQLNESVFERLYICMQAMKDGLKAGCRPTICLDGCHLKGYYRGQLLAAVGMDANDSLYPLAFAIVEVESESSWCWFLERLMTDLELNNSHHISFMTDRQKMILEARDKPIITLVESIRTTLMQRIAKMRAEAEKLTGIPCIHAISVILLLEEKPESYVDPCYSVSTQMAIYSHFITPVRGENQWTHQHGMTENVLPPILRRPPGRSHKKRRERKMKHHHRASEPTVHQDQNTTPSPRPSQPGIHTQSNIPRPSQPNIHTQSNIPRPSQPLPPPKLLDGVGT
ncbi:hypothetical protein V6N13_033959 [Hibiscus sabdariffa]